MTGPTSWMQFQDVHAASGPSEAWSELLGLRSNPRTSPHIPTAEAPHLPPLGSPASSSLLGFDSLSSPLAWSPSVESARKEHLGATTSAMPRGSQQPLAMPPSGLHTLDPFFSPVVGGSGRQGADLFSPVASRNGLFRNMTNSSGSLSESASHPLLCRESRGKLTPATSHNALVGEAYAQVQTKSLSRESSGALLQHEAYRRAALDFVLELAGPQTPLPSSSKDCHLAPDVIKADELPIPAFAINRDAHVCMWNRQMEELSGWEASDLFKGLAILADVFQPEGAGMVRSRGCLELMRSVLFGLSVPPETRFTLKKAIRKEGAGAECAPVELRFSRRTDIVGHDCGVLCVVVPQKPAASDPPRSSGACQRSPAPQRNSWQERDGSLLGTPYKRQEVLRPNLPLFDRFPNSSSSSCSGTSSQDGPPLSPSVATALPLVLVDQALHAAQAAAGQQESAPAEVRALVMESVDAVRMELKQNLERCGLEVTGCSSLGEAMWRFERSLSDPADGPRFDLIFLELESQRDDLFLAIRDLRRLEVESKVMGQVPTLEAVHLAMSTSKSADHDAAAVAACEPTILEEESKVLCMDAEGSSANLTSLPEHLQRQPSGVCEGSESGDEGQQAEVDLGVSSLPRMKSAPQGLEEEEPDSTVVFSGSEENMQATSLALERERRCLILAVVNLNRWDLAALDAAMEQCVRAGGDAVIPRGMPLRQLKTALRKLGIRSKYLMFPSRLPRSLSGRVHTAVNTSS